VSQLEGVRRFGHSLWLSFLAHAYLQGGRTEAALERARLALELSRQNGERGSEAYAMRLLGEIASHARCADDDTARAYYRRASELAAEIGMRPLVAHCHLGLGKLSRTNEHERALEHLTTAATMYRDMGMTYWLKRAEAAMLP
jgi:tetratricopeptide (TPR) repeat protein